MGNNERNIAIYTVIAAWTNKQRNKNLKKTRNKKFKK